MLTALYTQKDVPGGPTKVEILPDLEEKAKKEGYDKMVRFLPPLSLADALYVKITGMDTIAAFDSELSEVTSND